MAWKLSLITERLRSIQTLTIGPGNYDLRRASERMRLRKAWALLLWTRIFEMWALGLYGRVEVAGNIPSPIDTRVTTECHGETHGMDGDR